ncbi:MAG: T9SS type A sorting domain-containing protein [Flavobacteriia bacterium]|nr:T9SS type A sorting domain-containing protein [Flavobacteriia bacterium]MBH2023726.1 T9SS type A sorting domain-containing protein [Flavobacteriales bacterium]
MKKFYSLVAAVVFAVTVNAQTTIFSATFDDVNGTGGNDGLWGGGIATGTIPASYGTAGWAFTSASGAKQAIKAGTGSNQGSVTTPALSNLSGNATLTFRAGAWDGSSEKVVLNVAITGGGTLDKATVTLVKGAFTEYTVAITSGTATSKLVFSGNGGNSRFFIDDIVVTAVTQAVGDVNATNANLVKNTVVSNNILFAAKADVQIVSMNGQVVKSASVNENTTLDVASLAKGTYIVTGTVNGKAVSQKIIKK